MLTPANQADAVPQGEIPGARGVDVEPDVFRYEDFADRVAQSRAKTQARYGFTEASDDIVMMARERANPHDIRFTQDTISPYFSNRPGTINDTIQALREGRITPDDIPPIKVVEYKGQLWSLDNRRLASFQYAGVKDIPIIRVDLNDPRILEEFENKFRPIEGGRKVIIVPSRDREEARKLLRAYEKYTED
jgi:hypothetical protein